MSLLEVRGIEKSFGKTSVLKGIDFTLEKGEVDLEGRIDSLTYSDHTTLAAKGESLLGRLFK